MTPIGWILGALLLAPTPPDEGPAGLDRLQGTWMASSSPFDGEPTVVVTLVIAGDRHTTTVETGARHSFTSRGRLRVDPATDPGHLDWVETIGPDGRPVPDAPAIFRFEGDTLVICTAAPGGDRPSAFEAGRGRYPSLRRYERPADGPRSAVVPPGEALTRLQGVWNGRLGPAGNSEMTLAVRGEDIRLSLTIGDGRGIEAVGAIRVDEATDPPTLDLFGLSVNGQDADDMRAIFEFEGDSLRLRSGLPGAPRPSTFDSPWTAVLRREAEPDPVDDAPDDEPARGG